MGERRAGLGPACLSSTRGNSTRSEDAGPPGDIGATPALTSSQGPRTIALRGEQRLQAPPGGSALPGPQGATAQGQHRASSAQAPRGALTMTTSNPRAGPGPLTGGPASGARTREREWDSVVGPQGRRPRPELGTLHPLMTITEPPAALGTPPQPLPSRSDVWWGHNAWWCRRGAPLRVGQDPTRPPGRPSEKEPGAEACVLGTKQESLSGTMSPLATSLYPARLCTCTHVRTRTHARPHTCAHTLMCTRTHMHTHTHMHKRTPTRTCVYIHTCMHTLMCTDAHTHTHTCTHTHACTH